MKKALVFSQNGNGMRFAFVSILKWEHEWREWDGKAVGSVVFWVADIKEGIDGDLDNMVLVIPPINNDIRLVWSKEANLFVKEF